MNLAEIRCKIQQLKSDKTVLTGMRHNGSTENVDIAILELLDEVAAKLEEHIELRGKGLLRRMTNEEKELNKGIHPPIFFDVTKGPLR